MEEYTDIIDKVVRRMPREYQEDARQAGYLGLLKGLKSKEKIKNNFRGYLFRCVKNEVLKTVGELHRPFALNTDIFCLMIKYRHMKSMGLEKLLELDQVSINDLEKLLRTRQRDIDI